MNNKRSLLKLIAATPVWTAPVVQSVMLPAHAISSGIPCGTVTVPGFTVSVDCGVLEEQFNEVMSCNENSLMRHRPTP